VALCAGYGNYGADSDVSFSALMISGGLTDIVQATACLAWVGTVLATKRDRQISEGEVLEGAEVVISMKGTDVTYFNGRP
jgi:hypothetical protein